VALVRNLKFHDRSSARRIDVRIVACVMEADVSVSIAGFH
jgi:hypothetical protein